MPNDLDVAYTFQLRPIPLPANLRAELRIALLLLTLDQCHSKRATRKHLHVLNWAIRDFKGKAAFTRVLSGERTPDEAIVRFDPVLDRALDLAIGEKLVFLSGDTVFVTPKGELLLKEIKRAKDLLLKEKEFLASIGRKLTKQMLDTFVARNTR